MDLNDLTFRDTYTHTILHPITKDPVLHKDGAPQTITLYGSDSKGYRNALAEVARLGIDDPDERLMAFLALITTAWHVYAGELMRSSKTRRRSTARCRPRSATRSSPQHRSAPIFSPGPRRAPKARRGQLPARADRQGRDLDPRSLRARREDDRIRPPSSISQSSPRQWASSGRRSCAFIALGRPTRR